MGPRFIEVAVEEQHQAVYSICKPVLKHQVWYSRRVNFVNSRVGVTPSLPLQARSNFKGNQEHLGSSTDKPDRAKHPKAKFSASSICQKITLLKRGPDWAKLRLARQRWEREQ